MNQGLPLDVAFAAGGYLFTNYKSPGPLELWSGSFNFPLGNYSFSVPYSVTIDLSVIAPPRELIQFAQLVFSSSVNPIIFVDPRRQISSIRQ